MAKEKTQVIYKCTGALTGDGLRVGCGTIMNELIDKIIPDGKTYEVPCPKCGSITKVCKNGPGEK